MRLRTFPTFMSIDKYPVRMQYVLKDPTDSFDFFGSLSKPTLARNQSLARFDFIIIYFF